MRITGLIVLKLFVMLLVLRANHRSGPLPWYARVIEPIWREKKFDFKNEKIILFPLGAVNMLGRILSKVMMRRYEGLADSSLQVYIYEKRVPRISMKSEKQIAVDISGDASHMRAALKHYAPELC